MAKRMLIDATHPDEARVVVVSGNKVDEFDYETADKTQLKGNIYLAKITRVEPSLQAAFVDYGGNRHGFLPFSEIHPDYYRIPIADREALVAEEESLREEQAEADDQDSVADSAVENEESAAAEEAPAAPATARRGKRKSKAAAKAEGADEGSETGDDGDVEEVEVESSVDTVGGDEVEDAARRRAKLLRHYKIQEVIKRRQVILVQVTKEERGTKGAALTTYLSLAGRYCVLMPNTGKGGGISRKISNANDRRRLKSVLSELSIPEGMAVIVRTAGSQRTKAEIRRDYEYLLRLWDDIRNKTLQSTAPELIHEEANLIKRCIRDLYSREMDEVLVEGEDGYKAARTFMKMLMPSHVKNIQFYKDAAVPLFHRYQVEAQLDAMYSPSVQLRSGGSIVLNSTEALVAIDVNSGRATKERHIEETALKTNLEAAEEVARQLRLRDLAGLIVIDFIDMEDPRHNRDVERKLKDAMRGDRARIQLGRISPFGLLELSRQRLRPSLFETEMVHCEHCSGTGFLRSANSASLHALRTLTEEAIKNGAGTLEVTVATSVALYLLNEKRRHLQEMEERYGVTILVRTNDALTPPKLELQRLSREGRLEPTTESEASAETSREEETRAESGEEKRERRGGRNRRGGKRRRGDGEDTHSEQRAAAESSAPPETVSTVPEGEESDDQDAAAQQGEGGANGLAADGTEDGRSKRRRRGKRGGRRRSRRNREDNGEMTAESAESDQPQATPAENIGDLPAAPVNGDGQLEPQPSLESAEPPASESAADDAAEPTEASPATKPKRARRPRKKPAPAELEASAEDSGQPAVEDAQSAEPEPKEAAPEKPKRARRPARKKTAAVSEVEIDLPAPPAPSEAGAAEPPISPEAPISSNTPESDPAIAAEASQSDQPRERRRGWWNRLLE